MTTAVVLTPNRDPVIEFVLVVRTGADGRTGLWLGRFAGSFAGTNTGSRFRGVHRRPGPASRENITWSISMHQEIDSRTTGPGFLQHDDETGGRMPYVFTPGAPRPGKNE